MTETNLDKKIISQHIFMFPFRLKKDYTLENLKNILIKDGWDCKSFDFKFGDEDAAAKYNEYVYFHEYVRRTIFNEGGINNDNTSLYFERAIPNDASIVLFIIKGNSYALPIIHISLRLFNTNVGILTIELLNYEYPSSEDILIINDFGRRIYPQFIGEKKGIEETKGAFLADKIILHFGNDEISEDFKAEDFLKAEIQVAKYVEYLLGETLKKEVMPVIDDRMFTLCWYGNDELSKSLCSKKGIGYEYETSDFWYSLIYVDGYQGGGIASKEMQKELIKTVTYNRWVDYGILYGISRYSFMCLTDSNSNGFGYKTIRNHMQRIYYQMAVILLVQKASILKFSNDISKITSKAKVTEEIVEQVKYLYSSFIRFTNKLWFTEVTPQEQGIEMYNMAVKNMGLEEQLKELRYEIERLHEFVDMLYEKKISKGLRLLQIISFFIVAPMLAVHLINMGVFSANIKIPIFGFNIINGLLFIILTVIIFIILWLPLIIVMKGR